MQNDMTPIFIGGAGRSGTTMLASLLGGGPSVVVPESHFKKQLFAMAFRLVDSPVKALEMMRHYLANDFRFGLWGIAPPVVALSASRPALACTLYRAIMDACVRSYADTHALGYPTCWVDHTPGNIHLAAELMACHPNARMVHLVRDGRAVAASVMPLDWGAYTVTAAAKYWLWNVEVGVATEQLYPERVIRVHYEQLVANPAEELRRLCGFLGMDYSASMLNGKGFNVPGYTRQQHLLVGEGPVAGRADAWKNQLGVRQIALFERIAGDWLKVLGYQLSAPPMSGLSYELYRTRDRLLEPAMRKLGKMQRRKRERLGRNR